MRGRGLGRLGCLRVCCLVAVVGMIVLGCGERAGDRTVSESRGASVVGHSSLDGAERARDRAEVAGRSGPTVSLPTTLDPSISPPTTTMTRTVIERPESPGGSRCRVEITATNEQIGFAFDSAALDEVGQALIAQLAEELADASSITVVGHTSAEGERSYNLELSRRRAETVATALSVRIGGTHVSGGGDPSGDQVRIGADDGVDTSTPPSIVAMGVGPDQPIADNATEEGRRQNRRVEVIAEVPATRCG